MRAIYFDKIAYNIPPLPPSRVLFAAFTIASIFNLVMSPRKIAILLLISAFT